MAANEKDSAAPWDSAWFDRLAESRDKWERQRVVMEAHLSALQETLDPRTSPESRAMLALVDAQCDAVRALFAARAAAAEDLLVAHEATRDFSRVAGRRAADAMPIRLARVSRTLLEAQEGAAETLLAAQTAAAQVLRAEEEVDGEKPDATQTVAQDPEPPS